MNSIAIWSDNNIELDLHINIWHTMKRINWYKKINNKIADFICPLKKINEFSNYIEFGIKILKNNTDDNHIYLYLPIKYLKKRDVSDKTFLLKDDIKLTKALFNSKAEFVSDENNENVKLKLKNNQEIVYKKVKYDNFEEKELGTIMKFKIEKKDDSNPSCNYYRFRINKIFYNLIKEIDNNSSWIDGYLDKKAILEFNINHLRKIPFDLEFKQNIDFENINCFLLTDDDIEIMPLNSKYSARVLEKHIWNDYVDTNIKLSNIIAYQWDFKNEDKDKLNSLSLLIKLAYRVKKISYFVKVILFALLISAVGGIIGNLGTDVLKQIKGNYESNSTKTSK